MTEVLIHLNITVATDDTDQALAIAEAYCREHGISEHVALIDPQ